MHPQVPQVPQSMGPLMGPLMGQRLAAAAERNAARLRRLRAELEAMEAELQERRHRGGGRER